MRVRITGGEFGGRFIKTLPTLRPTSDLVRKALFDILGDLVEDKTFLDLYAGSGAVGIEALSRGASHATFIENSKNHVKVINDNLESLNLRPYATVRLASVDTFLDNQKDGFDIIFADPWYQEGITPEKYSSALLNQKGILVVEHHSKFEPPTLKDLQVINHKVYGDTALTFYTTA
jgi:16S rRNA (guanine966-N2)-methyltransferase